MLIERKIRMVIPSGELGKIIADEDAETQVQILKGYVERRLVSFSYDYQSNKLIELLPNYIVIWFDKIHKELVSRGRISLKEVIDDAKASKNLL